MTVLPQASRGSVGARCSAYLARRGLLMMFLLFYTIANLAWVWVYRRGQPYDIDESGYLSFSLVFHNALGSDGIAGWAESILSPTIFAPLTTAASSLPYLLFGPAATTGLIVPVLFGTQVAYFSYLIGDRLGGQRCAWIAIILVAGTPVLISYSRSYNFAIGAAAMFVAAVYFLLASEGMTISRHAFGFGIFFGLTALSRTVMLAFLPSLVIAAVVVIVSRGTSRIAVRNAIVAGLAALIVALPWYARNGRAVFEYLTSFGYGDRSVEYGRENDFLSWGAWRETLNYVVYSLGLPFALVSFAAVALAAAYVFTACRRHGPRSGMAIIARSPVLPIVLLVIYVVILLTTSRNKGSGFLAPVAPVLMVLVAWAFTRPAVWRLKFLPLAAAGIAAVNFAVAVSPSSPLGTPRYVNLPGYGDASLIDGRGTIQAYEAADDPQLQDTGQPLSKAEGEAWVAMNAYVAQLLRDQGGAGAVSAFAFRHRLLNANSVQLQQLLHGDDRLPVDMITPRVTGDTVAGYLNWLQAGVSQRACNLLTSPGDRNEFTPVVAAQRMERAAVAAGFVAAESFELPDGRIVTLWKRAEFCPVGP